MQQAAASSSHWFVPEVIGATPQEVKVLTKWQRPLSEIFEGHFGYSHQTDLSINLTALKARLISIGPPVALSLPGEIPKELRPHSELYFGPLASAEVHSGTDAAEAPSVQKHLLQPVLNRIFEMTQSSPPKNPFALEAFIRQILGLYILQQFESKDDQPVIAVPIFSDGGWRLVNYSIEALPLSEGVNAYGLKPLALDGPPLLIFKGTGRPGDPGFIRELDTDLTPGKMVGRTLFEESLPSLSKWVETIPDGTLCVSGISLGGSMGLLTLLAFPHKIHNIFCYNCPAMLEEDAAIWEAKGEGNKPGIFIFLQHGDIISKLGTHWPKGSRVFAIFGENESPSFNESHNALFLCSEHAVLVEVDPEKERGWQSRALTVSHAVASSLAFPVLKAARYFQHLFK